MPCSTLRWTSPALSPPLEVLLEVLTWFDMLCSVCRIAWGKKSELEQLATLCDANDDDGMASKVRDFERVIDTDRGK